MCKGKDITTHVLNEEMTFILVNCHKFSKEHVLKGFHKVYRGGKTAICCLLSCTDSCYMFRSYSEFLYQVSPSAIFQAQAGTCVYLPTSR